MHALMIRYRLSLWLMITSLVISAAMMIPTKMGVILWIFNALIIIATRCCARMEVEE